MKQLRWIVVLIVLLSFSSLACAAFGGDEPTAVPEPTAATAAEVPAADEADEPAAEPEATAVPEPAEDAAPEPTAETAVEETTVEETTEETAPEAESSGKGETVDAGSIMSALGLDTLTSQPELNSYEFDMVMEVSGKDAASADVVQAVTFNILYSVDPPGMSMSFSGSGVEGLEEEMGEITMAQIGDNAYMVMPELGCMTLPAGDSDLMSDNPMSDMFENDMFNDVETLELVGEETVNGIETIHYRFDETNMPPDAANDIEEMNGDVYIAKDGGYMVRFVMNGFGGGEEIFDDTIVSDQAVSMEMNLRSVNEPVEIAMPLGCEAGAEGGGSEYPVTDDAFEMTAMAGLSSYKSYMSVEDVQAFYDQTLSADGWTYDAESSIVAGGTALLNYTRDGETLSLTIGEDTDVEGAVFVLLIAGE